MLPDVETNCSPQCGPSPSSGLPPAQKCALGAGVETSPSPKEHHHSGLGSIITGTLIGCQATF